MREIRNILSAFDQLIAIGESAVLASVVAVNGSTYRRPGARTLILPDETPVGLVSGGCLEGDLVLRAREVRADGEPRLAHYDSTQESDIVWGLGLGCAGMVEVLLERVDARHPGPLDLLRECLATRRPAVIVTPLGSDGANPPAPFERLSLQPRGGISGTTSSEAAAPWLEAEAQRCLAAGRSAVRRFDPSSEFADESDSRDRAQRFLFEFVQPALRLLIFGTGVDAAPLAQLAVLLGWDVSAIGNRPGRARPAHFSADLKIEELDPRNARACIDGMGLDDRCAAVVMTHHYLDDREILRALLATPIRYVGLLGPRQRGNDLISDLRGEAALPEAARLEQLFSPAGLDVGADSPEQIALAVAAEIQAVFSERSGSWLRDRKGPIHEPFST